MFCRYIRMVVLTEYSALFSPINTTIMVWGSNILLLIIFIGPTYGWGEYSHIRGIFVARFHGTIYRLNCSFQCFFWQGELAVLFHIANGTSQTTEENFFQDYISLQEDFVKFLSRYVYWNMNECFRNDQFLKLHNKLRFLCFQIRCRVIFLLWQATMNLIKIFCIN